MKGFEPDFQLAIDGYTERSDDTDPQFKKHLRYDFARNHLDDRELSDEEQRLFKGAATAEEPEMPQGPLDTQLFSQFNVESQETARDEFDFNSDDIAAIFETQF